MKPKGKNTKPISVRLFLLEMCIVNLIGFVVILNKSEFQARWSVRVWAYIIYPIAELGDELILKNKGGNSAKSITLKDTVWCVSYLIWRCGEIGSTRLT